MGEILQQAQTAGTCATAGRSGKLSRRPEEIAAALTEDSPHGRLLRETSPVFGKGLTSRDVAELIAHADAPAR
jgi:hypothetical protein